MTKKRSEVRKRPNSLNVRLSAPELDRLTRAAADANMTVNTYMRLAALYSAVGARGVA